MSLVIQDDFCSVAADFVMPSGISGFLDTYSTSSKICVSLLPLFVVSRPDCVDSHSAGNPVTFDTIPIRLTLETMPLLKRGISSA